MTTKPATTETYDLDAIAVAAARPAPEPAYSPEPGERSAEDLDAIVAAVMSEPRPLVAWVY
ncbi:hypothetical protein QQX09_12195 [Demequina sp. SYSU T00192]|uniref:Uncharacterized protein n=1 Tax=Demequina litoralis TaxID=3051660 RepID=A0ABT8GBV7_9MICO|nr:hypothetical protein [Demequina sp. SYSU T00192]MDN4476618.1 hypothetical protein [Demequina sp. SYSU T00192]